GSLEVFYSVSLLFCKLDMNCGKVVLNKRRIWLFEPKPDMNRQGVKSVKSVCFYKADMNWQ
ncbi:13764_t:CDS:1, partial [Racocetra fulgida]